MVRQIHVGGWNLVPELLVLLLPVCDIYKTAFLGCWAAHITCTLFKELFPAGLSNIQMKPSYSLVGDDKSVIEYWTKEQLRSSLSQQQVHTLRGALSCPDCLQFSLLFIILAGGTAEFQLPVHVSNMEYWDSRIHLVTHLWGLCAGLEKQWAVKCCSCIFHVLWQ